MRRIIAIVCLVATVGALAHPAPLRAEEQQPEEIDYVSLAARLLKDEHYDRAENALRQANTKAPNFDVARYHTLLGVVLLKKKVFKDSRNALAKAVEEQLAADREEAKQAAELGDAQAKAPDTIRADPALLLYLAQACYGMKDYRAVLRVLERAGEDLDDEVSVHLMRAQAYWELEEPAGALAALRRGERAFPQQTEFLRLQVFYLIELGIYLEALEQGQRYLERGDAEARDYVAVGEALRKGHQLDQAAVILESAHMRFPLDSQVMLALAHVYIDQDLPLAAGMLLEDAARFDDQFAGQAAELYKRAGRLSRALSLNARVLDQKEKLKQRLAILLEMERFELVAAMGASLSREGLLQDDSVRYALAYGFYRIGDFAGAEQHLRRITQAELLNNANQLRRAMENCRDSGWECF